MMQVLHKPPFGDIAALHKRIQRLERLPPPPPQTRKVSKPVYAPSAAPFALFAVESDDLCLILDALDHLLCTNDPDTLAFLSEVIGTASIRERTLTLRQKVARHFD